MKVGPLIAWLLPVVPFL